MKGTLMKNMILSAVCFLFFTQSCNISGAQQNEEKNAAQLLAEIRVIIKNDNDLINQLLEAYEQERDQRPYPEAAIEVRQEGEESPRTQTKRLLENNRRKLKKALKKLGVALDVKQPVRKNSCFY
jgi:hypothetical protein